MENYNYIYFIISLLALIIFSFLRKRRWSKWTLHEEGKEFKEITRSTITGKVISERDVVCDALKRHNAKTGEIEYKNVKRF